MGKKKNLKIVKETLRILSRDYGAIFPINISSLNIRGTTIWINRPMQIDHYRDVLWKYLYDFKIGYLATHPTFTNDPDYCGGPLENFSDDIIERVAVFLPKYLQERVRVENEIVRPHMNNFMDFYNAT